MGVVTEGILAMPYELAMADELTRMQFYQTVKAELATLRAENEALRAQAERIRELEEALRRADCPRPCNGRPDDFEVGQCVDADECGCCLGHPLRAKEETPDA